MTNEGEKEMSKSMKCLVVLLIMTISGASLATTSIFSMNLHCALGNWKERTDIVIKEIIKRDPDIIGFQEVCHNHEVDMADYIVNKLKANNYPVRFSKTAETHRTFIKYREQLLIISKLAVKNSSESWLPSMKFFENKYLAIEVKDFIAITTHLHFALPQIREKQYRVLADKFSTKKVIVFGDLNSNPDNGETMIMDREAWVPFFGEPTYPSSRPNKTFDGFWASQSFAAEITSHEFEVLFKNHNPAPSDHLGIWLKVE